MRLKQSRQWAKTNTYVLYITHTVRLSSYNLRRMAGCRGVPEYLRRMAGYSDALEYLRNRVWVPWCAGILTSQGKGALHGAPEYLCHRVGVPWCAGILTSQGRGALVSRNTYVTGEGCAGAPEYLRHMVGVPGCAGNSPGSGQRLPPACLGIGATPRASPRRSAPQPEPNQIVFSLHHLFFKSFYRKKDFLSIPCFRFLQAYSIYCCT